MLINTALLILESDSPRSTNKRVFSGQGSANDDAQLSVCFPYTYAAIEFTKK